MHTIYPPPTLSPSSPDHHDEARSFSMASYDLDDAFSDGDDVIQDNFTLSRDAVREEFNKSRDASWDDPDATPMPSGSGFFEAQDTSMTTIELDDSARSSPEHSTSRRSRSPIHELPTDFSHISLSEHEPSRSEPPPEDEEPSGHDPFANGHTSPHATDEVEPYPHVIIDVSKTPGNRVSITSDSRSPSLDGSTRSRTPPTPPTSRSLPSTSLHSPADGNSSASLNTALSQPTPEIPQSTGLIPALPNAAAANATLAAPQKPNGHRPTRSTGPSMFEKVRSKTRPTFLPPKNRTEDRKHMADWESMMKQSRAAAEKKRKALQDRRLARERKIEESLHIWERDILPDWKAVRTNRTLRKLWWKGIPTKLRASMWEKAVGNTLALSKENYRSYLARAKRALSSGVFPAETLAQIEADILTTLPSLHIFHPEIGPMHNDLKDMLCAWTVSRSDEGLGYVPGASKIAAMFLLNMPPQQGFIVMRNLLERHCMRSFFGGENAKDDVEAYYR
ncbi:hypothetical protein HGRIS_008260 [Hohenbuehelia grisea]|uniref:Rab-GAP TBC domain-containing protein n=1 Tax=Hohenbuehelia grisea TaxID=104357 RepID=A0ABR3J7Y2_9AGAR